jgi:ubiquinone/menaquinone biosynthesis C-methylase UbiE
MTDNTIRFEDGAAYERMMGVWSRSVGATFLDWLDLPRGRDWIDVGCGNGAFTALVAERCAPKTITGVDPSDGQLAFARKRDGLSGVDFRQGDAMALPFADGSFDVAVMALVLFFVPEPEKGVAEMRRVVRPGGTIAAYVWDMPGGGFPNEPLRRALRKIGLPPPTPPSEDVSRMPVLRAHWSNTYFESVETRVIEVERRYANFEEYWTVARLSPSVQSAKVPLSDDDRARLKDLVREDLSVSDDARPLVATAFANAIKGRLRG